MLQVVHHGLDVALPQLLVLLGNLQLLLHYFHLDLLGPLEVPALSRCLLLVLEVVYTLVGGTGQGQGYFELLQVLFLDGWRGTFSS